MPVGNFNLPLQGNYWTPPSDWIDISSVNNNEINLLVRDGYALKFIVDVASSGTYSIDWGDGVIENSRASGTGYAHTYTLGGGTPCSLGYTTFRIRIYNATNTITRFRFQNLQASDIGFLRTQVIVPVLWAVFGTTGLTSMANAFFASSNYFCPSLQAVFLPSTYTSMTSFSQTFAFASSLLFVRNFNVPWGNVTAMDSTFSNCASLNTIQFPTTLPNTITTLQSCFNTCVGLETVNFSTNFPNSCTNFTNMFDGCRALKTFKFPSSWPTTASAQNYQAMFRNCNSITNLTLPSSWPTTLNSQAISFMFQGCVNLQSMTFPSSGLPSTITNLQEIFNGATGIIKIDFGTSGGSGVTSLVNAFVGCSSLQEIILPTSMPAVTDASGAFSSCSNLQSITNLSGVGRNAAGTGTNFTSYITSSFITSITTDRYISRFTIDGTTTNVNAFTSVRLTQAGSTYTGTSPQINVANNRLGQAALVDMFNDLPTLTAKTINITNNPGAALLTPAERAIATGKGWTIVG